MAEQTKAQRKRAEARGRRRGQATEGQSHDNQDDGALEGNDEQPLDAVKQAAKVAVAGAAVGAAAAAARALTSRDDDDGKPEIIYGATVYRSDGCLIATPLGFPAYSKGVVPVIADELASSG